MPKMNGFEVLKNLREHPPAEKWQPVIIVSARTGLEDVKKGLSLEAEHYILKPCSINDILKAIRLMTSLIPQHKSPSEMKNDH
jgi:DNA-binding response OmpR family regulator